MWRSTLAAGVIQNGISKCKHIPSRCKTEWGGSVLVTSGELVARLRGGAPEATSSGEEHEDKGSFLNKGAEEVGEKEGSADADSATPMDIHQESEEKGGENEEGEEEGQRDKTGEGGGAHVGENKDEPQKKWAVECNGVSSLHMWILESSCMHVVGIQLLKRLSCFNA